MKLVLADLKQDNLDIAVADLTAAGAEAIGVRTDVSSLESVEALRDATLDRFGAVHVVCNNAGVASGAHGRLWEHETNDWRFAMSVHVYGVINGINAFVPHLIEARRGVPRRQHVVEQRGLLPHRPVAHLRGVQGGRGHPLGVPVGPAEGRRGRPRRRVGPVPHRQDPGHPRHRHLGPGRAPRGLRPPAPRST